MKDLYRECQELGIRDEVGVFRFCIATGKERGWEPKAVAVIAAELHTALETQREPLL